MHALLETDSLKKHYRMGETVVRALDGVSISIPDGQFLALLGPSGSGKSTLLNLIAGLDHPTSGTLRIDGNDGVVVRERLMRFAELEQDEAACLACLQAERHQLEGSVAAREIGQSADSLRQELVDLAEQDSAAYQAFVSARGLPRETDAQRAARASAMQDASKRSTEAPLRTARVAREALELARRIAPIGNRNAVSDAGVAAQLLSAAVRGATSTVGACTCGRTASTSGRSTHKSSTAVAALATSVAPICSPKR